jgi:hypothetical protein
VRTEHTAGLTMPTDEPIAGGEESQ